MYRISNDNVKFGKTGTRSHPLQKLALVRNILIDDIFIQNPFNF